MRLFPALFPRLINYSRLSICHICNTHLIIQLFAKIVQVENNRKNFLLHSIFIKVVKMYLPLRYDFCVFHLVSTVYTYIIYHNNNTILMMSTISNITPILLPYKAHKLTIICTHSKQYLFLHYCMVYEITHLRL